MVMEPQSDSFELPTIQETPTVKVTEKAVAKVKAFAQNNKEAEGKLFRVYIEGGGCSGFQYGFRFDEQRDDDVVFDAPEGLKFLVDPMSLQYLKGSVVDYFEDFKGSGFVVQNPNATSSCGCGTSFSA
ncbi:MAG: iron-sulfur cluster insertion protein ErpA [Deltaproteobacteria bacterium]|nr:iron-sulfur cluster insertion protein ErpA [Deltaproteobacteria bacterium]